MKKIIFSILLISVIFVSCKKNDNVVIEKPKSTKDLVANSTFDWKTTENISLNIIGMKEINPNIKNTLMIKSIYGDTTYYKDILYMNNDYVLNFVVPSIEKSIVIIYGSKIDTIDLTSNTINFDYIIE